MSEAKHTDVTWLVAESRNAFFVTDMHGTRICRIEKWTSEVDKGVARLMAAAPDLLRELKTSKCPGGGWNGMPPDVDPTVENCMAAGMCGCSCGAAIAKATGESP